MIVSDMVPSPQPPPLALKDLVTLATANPGAELVMTLTPLDSGDLKATVRLYERGNLSAIPLSRTVTATHGCAATALQLALSQLVGVDP
jgi:hypothetical protein